jgi:threonine aldolase
MVFLNLGTETGGMTAQQVADELAQLGIMVGPVGLKRFRLVTHYWIDDAAIQEAVAAFNSVLTDLAT